MKKPTEKRPCCGLDHRWTWKCYRSATKFEDGKWYCYQHAPSYKKAKAKKEQEEYRRRQAELEIKWDAQDARRKLEQAADVDNLSDSDLRIIAKLGGIYAMICALDGVAERE